MRSLRWTRERIRGLFRERLELERLKPTGAASISDVLVGSSQGSVAREKWFFLKLHFDLTPQPKSDPDSRFWIRRTLDPAGGL
jgi:hypothetical protein